MSEGPKTLSCERFFAFMRAYRDGELPPEVRGAFLGHLEACPPCEDWVEGYARTIEMARSCCAPEPAAPPEDLVAAILTATASTPDDDAADSNEP